MVSSRLKILNEDQTELVAHNIITPEGLAQRTPLAVQFLIRKVIKYDALEADIEALKGQQIMNQLKKKEPS